MGIYEVQFPNSDPYYLFKCLWYDTEEGVGLSRDYLNFTILDTTKMAFEDEPFIYPKQAIQVFYSRDPEDGNLCVVCPWVPRDTYDIPIDISSSETPIINVDITTECISNEENDMWVRSDIDPEMDKVDENLIQKITTRGKRRRYGNTYILAIYF